MAIVEFVDDRQLSRRLFIAFALLPLSIPEPSLAQGWSVDPQLIPSGLVPRGELERPFVFRGVQDNKNLDLMGGFEDSLYFYYRPNIDPKTGRGKVVFEITNGNKSLGNTLDREVGVIVNYLDKDRTSRLTIHHHVKIKKPGMATDYPVIKSQEFWQGITIAHLRWYIVLKDTQMKPNTWPIINQKF